MEEPWFQRRMFGVAVVTTLLTQMAFGIWYASKLDSRVGSLEISVSSVIKEVPANKDWQIGQRQRVWDRVAKLNESMLYIIGEVKGISSRVNVIDSNVDRILDRLLDQTRKVEN